MRCKLIFLLFLLPLLGRAQGQMPELNRAVIAFVDENMGKKVGRGECWDLANEALAQAGADWDGQYVFGRLIADPLRDTVWPGDIIQFSKVTIRYEKDNSIITESYPHHTAIVYKVIGPGKYRIAHQNNGFSGRKVGVSDLRLEYKTGGKLFFYRPEKRD